MVEFGNGSGILPVVSTEAFLRARTKLFDEQDPSELRKIIEIPITSDRYLMDQINTLEERVADGEMLTYGAMTFLSHLYLLERDGIEFPKPTDYVVDGLIGEWRNALDTLDVISERHRSGEIPEEEAKKLLADKIEELDFDFPIPEDYKDENPELMGLIAPYPLAGQWGALIVYEAKRRQAELDGKAGSKRELKGDQ